MSLIADYTQAPAGKRTANREQLIGLIQADAKFMDMREDIEEYVRTLEVDKPLNVADVKLALEAFIATKKAAELTSIATTHGLEIAPLQAFVDEIMRRRIFDGEKLSDLMAPLGLGWKARTVKELALMEELAPLLHRLAEGRDISGLSAYEQ
jgi:type I restriction enzyme, R subunit